MRNESGLTKRSILSTSRLRRTTLFPVPCSLFIVLCSLFIVLCFSCDLPDVMSRNGTVTIVLPGASSARSAYLDETMIGKMHYELNFTGPGGKTKSETATIGQTSVPVSLEPGDWEFTINAFYNEVGAADSHPAGTGNGSVTIVAGQKTTVSAAIDVDDGFFDEYVNSFVSIKAIERYFDGQASRMKILAGRDEQVVSLPVKMKLSTDIWLAILEIITDEGKDVELDLSECTPGSMDDGPGLRSDNTFAPDWNDNDGHDIYGCDKIVSLVFPDSAASIAGGFGNFGRLSHVDINNVTEVRGLGFSDNADTLISVTIGSGVTFEESSSIPGNFEQMYGYADPQAGTYTRADRYDSWVKK